MSDSKEQEEPSMEEILASIRKIISEGDKESPADEDESVAEDEAEVEEATEEPAEEDVAEETPEETPEEEGAAEEEVLDLTQMVNEDGTVVDLTETPEEEAAPEEEAPAETSAPEPEPEPEPEEPPPATDTLELVDEDEEVPVPEPKPLPPLEPEEPLISPPVAATSTEAFANLADALVREKLIEGRTVEDLIKEILRPLLKQWLDDNLSGLVESLVKEEIEKLSERARNL